MTRKPTQHYAPTDDRRAAIAAAARALIVEHGFEGLRTRDIAARVGINVATLHYHVPSKEALIALVAQSLRDEFIAQHLSNPRENLTALERLELEFREYEDARRDTPELHLVSGELLTRARRDPVVAAIMRPMLDHWFGQIAAIMRDGVADGSFRADVDPDAAARVIIGALTWHTRNACAPDLDLSSLAAELSRSFKR